MDLKVDAVRAKTPQRMPTVLSKEEVVASSGATQRLRPLVAFSCALRRDKLDGSGSGPSSGSAPNLLRNLGSRPSFALCDSGGLAASSTSTSAKAKTAGPRSLVHYEDKDSLGSTQLLRKKPKR